MSSELRDAIAGIIYRKVLACPDRFPPELGAIVRGHQRIWKVTPTQIESPESKMAWGESLMWRNFVTELTEHSQQLPEWLAEDRD